MNSALVRVLAIATLSGGAASSAAALQAASETASPSVGAPAEMQIAQMREVDVFYDQDGTRILLDPYTGRVIAVQPPRDGYGRPIDRRLPDPIYRDEAPDYDAARERRLRQREVDIGRREPPPRTAPRETFEGDDFEVDRGYEDRGPIQALPAPQRTPDTRNEEPQFAEREPVTRSPLAPPSDETTGTVTPPTGQDSGSIIEVEPMPGNPTLGAPGGGEQPAPQIGQTGVSEELAKIQIVLDRFGAAPGVVDGRMGDNVNKAISAFREITGQALRTYDTAEVDRLLEETGGPAFMEYTITAVDAAGPFVASIPDDYGKKAELDRMSYTSVTEALAERFHMDENYLKRLNPGADFGRPGTVVKVANPGERKADKVVRIVADKARKQVRAYDETGRLVRAYPATIGSQDTPSPSGTHTVERIALEPEYTYNPKINFKQGDNDRILRIPPGPNGPVGSVWIALSKPTYGIHGTPEPSKIGKTYSNGCVRLTNWDAEDLAKRIDKGVTVEFSE
jgi:lipoprotein-anchoring transpeptidase ErfK/SrfK